MFDGMEPEASLVPVQKHALRPLHADHHAQLHPVADGGFHRDGVAVHRPALADLQALRRHIFLLPGRQGRFLPGGEIVRQPGTGPGGIDRSSNGDIQRCRQRDGEDAFSDVFSFRRLRGGSRLPIGFRHKAFLNIPEGFGQQFPIHTVKPSFFSVFLSFSRMRQRRRLTRLGLPPVMAASWETASAYQ